MLKTVLNRFKSLPSEKIIQYILINNNNALLSNPSSLVQNSFKSLPEETDLHCNKTNDLIHLNSNSAKKES